MKTILLGAIIGALSAACTKSDGSAAEACTCGTVECTATQYCLLSTKGTKQGVCLAEKIATGAAEKCADVTGKVEKNCICADAVDATKATDNIVCGAKEMCFIGGKAKETGCLDKAFGAAACTDAEKATEACACAKTYATDALVCFKGDTCDVAGGKCTAAAADAKSSASVLGFLATLMTATFFSL